MAEDFGLSKANLLARDEKANLVARVISADRKVYAATDRLFDVWTRTLATLDQRDLEDCSHY